MAADPEIIDFAKVRADLAQAVPAEPPEAAAAPTRKPRRTPSQDAPPTPWPPPDGPPDKGPRPADLPPECPVVPLGVSQISPQRTEFVYLDARRQVSCLSARRHSQLEMIGLCDGEAWLKAAFPRYGKPLADGRVPVNGMNCVAAAASLMHAASAAGIWREEDRLRGPGAWAGGGDVAAVYHNGDRIWLWGEDGRPKVVEPGMHGQLVYPFGACGPVPIEAGRDDAGEVAHLRELIGRWAWSRPELDPVLAVGFVAASIVGGALNWRPVWWVTGGAGTGKTTLREKVIAVVLGTHRISLIGGSEASLRREMGSGTLPVFLDELEAAEDDRRQQAILDLARDAASGGTITRVSEDGGVARYTVRACMAFAAITQPALRPAILSRMITQELRPLGGREMPAVDRPRLDAIGRILRRRLLSRWRHLEARIAQYQTELREGGLFDARGADVYGTVLGCAEVALFDDPEEMPASDRQWSAWVRAAIGAVAEERLSDETACLQHILSATVQPFGGGSAPLALGELVARAAGHEPEHNPEDAAKVLGRYGLRIEPLPEAEGGQGLAIANTHAGLAKVFAGTRWLGRAGSTSVWAQAARRAAAQAAGGVECSRPLSFGGVVSRAAVVPLVACPLSRSERPENRNSAGLLPGEG